MTAGLLDHILQKPAHCVELRAKARPISGFQWSQPPRTLTSTGPVLSVGRKRCGNPAVYDLPSRKWHWQCEKCAPDGYRFSHIAGTIFENTNKPLRDWYRIAHLMLTSKKGVRPGGRALPALRRHGPLRGQRCGCDEPPSSFQCSFCMSSRSDEYL